MTSKVVELAERVRTRRQVARTEDLHRANDRLQLELRTVRSELDRERDERDDLLDALRSSRVQKVVKKNRRGVLSILVVGTGAYVLGAKAGRERYDAIVAGVRSVRDRVTDRSGLEPDAADDVLVVPATGRERASEMSFADRSGVEPARGHTPIMPRDRDHQPPA